MKKSIITKTAFILLSICACCVQKIDANSNVFMIDDINSTENTSPSWLVEEKENDYSSYSDLLLDTEYEEGSYCTYSMYDINNDGVRELIMKVGTCEADYAYHLYGLDPNGIAFELGTIGGGHSSIYADETEPGIIVVYATQGFQTILHITENASEIESETVFDGAIGDTDYYSNSLPLSVCYIKDHSLLEPDAILIGKTLEVEEAADFTYNPSESEEFCVVLPITMNIIDTDFELFCKKSYETITEVHPDNIRGIPIQLKDNQRLYCVFGSIYKYMIVENGLIVGYITYNGSVSRDMSMKQYFPSDDCYTVSPKIMWYNSYAYCCWETVNSYIILGAIANPNADPGGYYNWSTTTYILIKDFTQFTFEK